MIFYQLSYDPCNIGCFHRESANKPNAVITAQNNIYDWKQGGIFKQGKWVNRKNRTVRFDQVTGTPYSG